MPELHKNPTVEDDLDDDFLDGKLFSPKTQLRQPKQKIGGERGLGFANVSLLSCVVDMSLC